MKLPDLDRPKWLTELLISYQKPINDLEWIQLLTEVALKSVENGGGPFAAAIIDLKGEVVDVNINSVTGTGDPCAHAEQLVLRNALRHRRKTNKDCLTLDGYKLISSAEPCVGCQGAIYLFTPSEVIWSVSKELVEKHSNFDEGPTNANFWDEANQRRHIRSKAGVEFSEKCLEPFMRFEEKIRRGETVPYLQRVKN